jgi:hypothetical protein
VRFQAGSRDLTLVGKPAAVLRDETLLVGRDIQFNDSTQLVIARGDPARGDTVVLRDPQQGSDVIVRGGITYNLLERRGVVSAFSTAVAQDETWFVAGARGAIVSDTTAGGQRAFYAHDGAITSCSETVPHYHFAARDIKMVARNLLVIRPAVLYIGDVPVMWLPFVFQDMRSGRRSGLLRPNFGVAELVRNSPNYRRRIENLGYYFNFGDYADASAWMDWRSGSRGTGFDPGFVVFNAETRYNVIDRFLRGRFSASYTAQRNGTRNAAFSVGHEQAFNQNRRVSANLNWVQNTTIQRQNQFNPSAVLATIQSQLNFQDQFGPASFSIGGTRKQYPGRPQVDQDFPNVNVSTRTISIGENVDWTPTLSLSNSQSFRIDQGTQFNYVYRPNRETGAPDSVALRPSRRNSQLRFETPLKIFDFNWQNSFAFTEEVQDFPQTRVIYRDVNDTTTREVRVFNQTFLSSIDWNTSFNLPRFFQGTWNVSPTLNLANVDQGGLFVRTERTGGRWVRQSKRASVGLSSAPTLYAFPRGFGPVERFRHSINPVISYSYSPTAQVSDDYLRAIGRSRQGYLGALVQNRVALQLSTNLEAKMRVRAPTAERPGPADGAPGNPAGAPGGGAASDSTGADAPALAASGGTDAAARSAAGGSANAEGRKVRVLTMNFSSLNYDFARADSVGKSFFNRSGFTDPTFSINARSDLLPGLDFRTSYSLFLGDPASDSAQFKPFRTDVGVTFSLDQNSAIFGTIARLFGRRIDPAASADTPGSGVEPGGSPAGDAFFNRQAVASQAAGTAARAAAFDAPTQGWQANVTYNASRQRTDIRGPTISLDPTERCRPIRQTGNLFEFERCVAQAQTAPPPGSPFGQTTAGAPIFLSPPQQSLQLNTGVPHHAEVVGAVDDQLRRRSLAVRQQPGVAPARAARLARRVRGDAVAQRELRLQLLHRAQGRAGPEVRLQPPDGAWRRGRVRRISVSPGGRRPMTVCGGGRPHPGR